MTEISPPVQPLVSIVIINWNYSAYIGRTIDSVKKQTYQNIEVLVVDNNSTDNSLQIIAEHIDGDERFQVVRLSENLGQLGAFFAVYEQLHGEFVVNVDADDTLFPVYVLVHVQAHLALEKPVALTSSDVTIIDKNDAIVLHGYRARDRHQPNTTGLVASNESIRLPQVSDQGYQRLDENVSTHIGAVNWIWGPGTSNMYRRSVLDMVYEIPEQPVWMRSGDNFINPICHAIMGTALIDNELSAYRVHGENFYGTTQGVGGGRRDKATREGQIRDFYETTESLLRRAKHYAPLLGDQYWDVLRSVSKFIAPPNGVITPGSPETLGLLERNYALLCEAFPEPVVQQQLRTVFSRGDIHRATGQVL